MDCAQCHGQRLVSPARWYGVMLDQSNVPQNPEATR